MQKVFQSTETIEKSIEIMSVPWWTMELIIRRKKINAIRRRYQRMKHESNLKEARAQQYLQEKRKYEATLRKTKMHSWKQYCNVTTASNPYNAVYKPAAGNITSCSSLSNLRKPDGTVTTDTTDMMRFMINSFTP